MKVRLGEIVGAQPILKRIMQAPIEKAKTAYRVARAGREVQDILDAYNEQRLALLAKHAVPLDNRDRVVLDKGDLDREPGSSRVYRYGFYRLTQDNDIYLDDDGKKAEDTEAKAAFDREHAELLEVTEDVNRHLNEYDHGNINEALKGSHVATPDGQRLELQPLSSGEVLATWWLWESLHDLQGDPVDVEQYDLRA